MRVFALLCLFASWSLCVVGADEFATSEPLPIRRMLLSPERVPAELEKARQGVLVQLTRAEFEAKVRQAVAAQQQLAPQLLRASYTARLEDAALVGGGDWTVHNPGRAPAVLAVAELNLALRKIKIQTADAIVAELNGKALGLLLEKNGKQSVYFDWSSRGEQRGDGMRFELQVPPCAVNSLELVLPIDHVVSAPGEGALVSGPFEAAEKDQRLWHISFSGRSRLALEVQRPAMKSAQPPLVLCQLTTTQQLAPDHLRARFDFDIEVARHGLPELVFVFDPILQPYEVIGHDLAVRSWEVKEAPVAKGGPPRMSLIVQLHQPVLGTGRRLSVLCQAALYKDRKNPHWTSPAMVLRQATVQREKLRISADPEVRLENWQAGSFRQVKPDQVADESQALVLLETGAMGGAAQLGKRPSATVKTRDADLRARQLSWWRITATGSLLKTEIDYEVASGSVFRLALQLPKDWQLDDVSFLPNDRVRAWHTVNSKKGPLLHLDLQNPLTPAVPGKLALQLRSASWRTVPATGMTLGFPDVEPLDKCLRAGTLAIGVDPILRLSRIESSVSAAAPTQKGPWGQVEPDFAFAYRNTAVIGKLTLVPHQPRVQAHCRTEVTLAPARGALKAQVTIEPLVGAPDTVDLHFSAPLPSAWSPKSENLGNPIRSVQRLSDFEAVSLLSALGQRNVLGLWSLSWSPLIGERWRLTFAKPLTKRETLIVELPLAPRGPPKDNSAGDQVWQVPVITVPSAQRTVGDMVFRSAGLELYDFTRHHLADAMPQRAGHAAEPRPDPMDLRLESSRGFRYEHDPARGQTPRLEFKSRSAAVARSTSASCDLAMLTSHLGPQGKLLHHFRFQISRWHGPTLKVVLPSSVRLHGVRVEDRWLARLTTRTSDAGTELELPAPLGLTQHRYELVYSSADEATWWLGTRLAAPCPRLPLSPLSLRRVWRLPEGTVPVDPSALRLPSPARLPQSTAWWEVGEDLWHGGRSLLTALGQEHAGADWEARQRQIVSSAEAGLRKKLRAGKDHTFGDFLEKLIVEQLKHEVPVVVDAQALQELGVRATSPIAMGKSASGSESAPPFWDQLGLVYIPCRTAALLTSKRQRDQWRMDAQPAPSETIHNAADDAVLNHVDGSGRFFRAAHWLKHADADNRLPVTDLANFAGTDAAGDSWTEWETAAGSSSDDFLVVVRADSLAYGGLALTLIFLILAWRLPYVMSAPWRLRLLFLWLAAAGSLFIWLPESLRGLAWGPILSGLLVAGIWYVRSAAPRAGAVRPRSEPITQKRSRVTSTITALIAVGVGVASFSVAPGYSGGPEPLAVFLVPSMDDAPEKQLVLLSPETLKRLDDIGRRTPAGSLEAVLLSANYEASVVGNLADFRAEYRAYSFADKANLNIPLSGVELKDGTIVDGVPTLPYPTPNGYTLPLKERGLHSIVMRFQARLIVADDEREIQFGIPKLVECRLNVIVPDKSEGLVVVSALGQQQRPRASTTRLQVDLGRVGSLHVRYRAADRAPAPALVQVREAFFWDLRQPIDTLTGVLQYSIKKGTLAQLTLALPEGLEVRQIDVQPLDSPAPRETPRLKNWHLTGSGGKRQLKVELDRPVSGDVQLMLRLIPRLTLAPGVMRLTLPTPLGVQAIQGALAYRVDGLETSDKAVELGVISMSTELFRKKWPVAESRDLVVPTRAYSYLRSVSGGTLQVTVQPARAQVDQQLRWLVDRQFADLEATLKLTASEETAVVEWEVPAPVTVARLTGADVRHWSRTGSRIQVWLLQPRKTTTIQLSGWLNLPPKTSDSATFALPCLRHPFAKLSATTLSLAPAPGLTLIPKRLNQLKAQLEQGPEQPRTYQSDQSVYAGDFQVRAQPVAPDVTVVTTLELVEGEVSMVSQVTLRVPHGELREAAVRLQDWEGDEVHVDAPPGIKVSPPRRAGQERVWTLTLPPGGTRAYTIKVTGKLAAANVKSIAMPRVDVPAARSSKRWLALAGSVPLKESDGVTLLAPQDVASVPETWLSPRRHGGSAQFWRIDRDDWQLRFALGGHTVTPRIQVVSARQEAAVLDGQRWSHQATYALLVSADTDLYIDLPSGAQAEALGLDFVNRRAPSGTTPALVVSLTRGANLQDLRIRWTYANGAESLAEPNLDAPVLRGLAATPTMWSIHVPHGYRTRTPAEQQVHTGPAWLELDLANIELSKSKQLAAQVQESPEDSTTRLLLSALQRFHWHCRQVEVYLATTPATTESGPERQSVLERLKELRRQNVSATRGPDLEKLRQASEKQPQRPPSTSGDDSWTLPARGARRYWQASATGQPPAVQLAALAKENWWSSLVATGLLAIALLALLVIASSPSLARWLRRFIPEQILFVAWLGYWAYGISLVGVFLFLAGLLARLIVLTLWLSARFHRAGAEAVAGEQRA
jgi:hypothetical protein